MPGGAALTSSLEEPQLSGRRGEEIKALRTLAAQHGVQVAYRDLSRRRRVASPDALLAVLRALGVALRSVGEANVALREREREQIALAPVTVAWNGRLRLSIQTGHAFDRIECTLHLEGGETRTYRMESGALRRPRASPAPAHGETVSHRAQDHYPWGAAIPHRLPFGYHRVEIQAGTERGASLVISAPRACADPGGRRWGFFAPVYALRSGERWGIGGYTELGRLAAWAHDTGAAVVGTLPLLPCFLDEPFEPSPYMPISRLCWNEAYIDPQRAAAASGVSDVFSMFETEPDRDELDAATLVDHRRAYAVKRRILTLMAKRTYEDPQRRGALERCLGDRPHLVEYARFRAAHERFRRPWREWPEKGRGLTAGGDVGEAARYYAYAQWVADAQVREAAGAGASLYLDLPLGVHPDGYDAWRYRDVFADGVSAGAPPDPLGSSGQDWGFAPLHPAWARSDGYAYLRACLRHHFQVAGMLRIDHVMGLHRLFWIPRGMPASEGVYVRYPADELYAVLLLEAHRHGAVVVGEDLGTVPGAVRETMRRRGLWQMYVLPFEVDADRPRPPAALSVASLSTHDTPPFAAFWSGGDIAQRHRLGLLDAAQAARERSARSATIGTLRRFLRGTGALDTDELHDVLRACLVYLGRSASRFVLVGLEDLLLETEPQNVPGTWSEYPNWRRRMRCDLDTLMVLPRVAELLAELTRIRGEPGCAGA